MICEVTSPSDPNWNGLHALFCLEFPPETREPDDVLLAEIDGRSEIPFRYWVALRDGHVVGFIRAARLSMGATFVIHLATDSRFRNQGIGKGLLTHVIAQLGPPVICEVEPGTPMEWWVHQGARCITPTYTQPALRPDTEPVPFHLMAIGSIGNERELIESFYSKAWGLAPNHPFVLAALEGLP